MNNSKLKSAFGIDDILYQNQKASSKLAECLNGRLDRNSAECSGSRSTMSDGSQSNFQSDIYGNQLKKPLALFPPIMDFSKPNFCISGLPRSFSPTSYLEQYASALTKGKFSIILFFFHYLSQPFLRIDLTVRHQFIAYINWRKHQSLEHIVNVLAYLLNYPIHF